MVNYQHSVDQSDRKIPINLRQSGPTPTRIAYIDAGAQIALLASVA